MAMFVQPRTRPEVYGCLICGRELPRTEGKTPRELCRPFCTDVNRYLAALERALEALLTGYTEKRCDPPLPSGGVWDLSDEHSAAHAKRLRQRLMLLTHQVPVQYHNVRDDHGRFAPKPDVV